MGVFYLVPGADFEKGLEGEALLNHFDVFLDASEVFGIAGEVESLKGKENCRGSEDRIKSEFEERKRANLQFLSTPRILLLLQVQ